MKRTKKIIEKRTYAMKNALPLWVSIVDRGANFVPLKELRFSEDGTERFGDFEINRIEFSKDKFSTAEAVSEYMASHNYEDFTVEETELTFFIPGVEADDFQAIQKIEYEDGVLYSVGKLKVAVEDLPVAEVVESDVLEQHSEEVIANEETIAESEEATVEEVEAGESAEVIAASETEEEVNVETTNDNVDADSAEVASDPVVSDDLVQESQEEVETSVEFGEVIEATVAQPTKEDKLKAFLTSEKYSYDSCDFRAQLEDAKARGVILTFDYVTYIFNDSAFCSVYEGDMVQFKKNCTDYFKAVTALVDASKNLAFNEDVTLDEGETSEVVDEEVTFSLTKADLDALIAEKFEQLSKKNELVVDDTEILLQNSQRISSDEVIENDASEETKTNEKFEQQKINDLYGIR